MPVNAVGRVGNLIRGVGFLIASFPGIIALLGIVPLPSAMVKTVTITAFSLSLVIVISVFLLDDWLRQVSKGRAIIYAISVTTLGGLGVFAYSEIAESYVVSIPESPGQESRFVIPAHPSLSFIDILIPVDPARPTKTDYEHRLRGSRDAAIFREDLHRESRAMRILMHLLLLVTQILLIVPVVAASWKLADSVGRRHSRAGSGAGPQRPRRSTPSADDGIATPQGGAPTM